MRGEANPQPAMFSYVDLESRIPADHPIRTIREVVDTALDELEDVFEAMYAQHGRPSIPPEMLLRALLLQILFSIRSERQLMERLDYDLLFRWFVGLGMDDPVWNHSTFSRNRDRLLRHGLAEHLLEAVNRQAYAKKLLSRDHFSVDGSLIEACASMKSFRPRDDDDQGPSGGDGNQGVDFHGERRTNATHASYTDPDAQLFRKGKGQPAKLCYMGHLLTENRNGLIVGARVTPPGTSQEWHAGAELLSRQSIRSHQTVGADKGYDTRAFVDECRALNFTPHVATRNQGSRVDGRTTGTAGYAVSQRKRKQIEECFGWMKDFGLLRKLRHRGLDLVDWLFQFTAVAYNLSRMKRLMA